MNRAQAVKYDETWAVLETKNFEWVEDAVEWCEKDAGETLEWCGNDDDTLLEWGDTQIGMEGTDKATRESIDQTGEYPLKGHPIYQISGLNDEGEMDEMLFEHWRGDETEVSRQFRPEKSEE